MVSHTVPVSCFPLVVEPEDGLSGTRSGLLSLLDDQRQWLEEELHRVGAILLRGFGITCDGDFEEVCRSLTPELKLYVEGNSPRKHTSDFVYTSTEYPPEFNISMHNELSYAHSPPERLYFNCQIAATTGGATPLVDSRKVLELLDPAVVRQFEERGILYVQNIHGGVGLGRSWQDTFETIDRDEVDRYLARGDVKVTWLKNGGLRTEQVRPAIRIHPQTGERVWFNQADQWHPSNLDEKTRQAMAKFLDESNYPLNAYFGDGSPIPPDALDHIRRTLWDASVKNPWQAGDVIVVDNFLVAHGRCAFSGRRAVRVAMS